MTSIRLSKFDNVDLKDLRVTEASLRLRGRIICASATYIFLFTPVLAYFVGAYMMAKPMLMEYDDPFDNRSRCSQDGGSHKNVVRRGLRFGYQVARSSSGPVLRSDSAPSVAIFSREVVREPSQAPNVSEGPSTLSQSSLEKVLVRPAIATLIVSLDAAILKWLVWA